MPTFPTAPVVAGSLVGGYAVGRATGVRALAGAALAAGGFLAGRQWARRHGAATTVALATTYVAAFGLSHPLAKKIGAWPSVATVAGAAAAVTWVVADRRA